MNSTTKNWHWRTKGVEHWAKGYWQEQLTGTEAGGVSIEKVTDVEGDCELGMRKSKLVTIYDQKITMQWTAEDSEGEIVTGTLIAVEVSHDMDEDEYVFTSTLSSSSSKEGDKFNTTAKKALANKLRSKFQEFPKAIIETHGKDLLAEDADSANNSGASTPAQATGKSTPTIPIAANASLNSGSSASTSKTANGKTFNTSVVKADGEFQCSAEDLFEFLTNEGKIPMWSRNPATMKPEVGAEMSLFGGNISGKVTAVEKPNSITTSWRAPTWPENYYGQLETTLKQGASSTTLTLRLSGVPVGKEEEAEKNLSIYYINGLKQIGSVLPSLSSPSLAASVPSSRKRKIVEPPSRWLWVANAAPIVISFGLLGALIGAFWYGPSGPAAASKATPKCA